jgi:hypothetical protein
MKKIIAFIFWAMIVIIPQSVNAYTLPLNMSLDSATTYVSEGSIFYVTWDVGVADAYSTLDSLYPQGWSVDWDWIEGFIRYNVNVVNLLSVNGNNTDSYDDGVTLSESGGITGYSLGLNRFDLLNNSLSLEFKALQNGYTNLSVEVRYYSAGYFFYYDPTDPNAFEGGWVQPYNDFFLEGSTISRINVPEPATMLLLGLGLLGLAGIRRRIKK